MVFNVSQVIWLCPLSCYRYTVVSPRAVNRVKGDLSAKLISTRGRGFSDTVDRRGGNLRQCTLKS